MPAKKIKQISDTKGLALIKKEFDMNQHSQYSLYKFLNDPVSDKITINKNILEMLSVKQDTIILENYNKLIGILKKEKPENLTELGRNKIKSLEKGYKGANNTWTKEWIVSVDGVFYYGQYVKNSIGHITYEGNGVKVDVNGIVGVGAFENGIMVEGTFITPDFSWIYGRFHMSGYPNCALEQSMVLEN
jgi:hypothetical protein